MMRPKRVDAGVAVGPLAAGLEIERPLRLAKRPPPACGRAVKYRSASPGGNPPGRPDVCVSKSRIVIGRDGFLSVNESPSRDAISSCPLNSGRCFSTGSSTDSFPSSCKIMIPIAVIGLVIDAMRKTASFGIGCRVSIRDKPTPSKCAMPSFEPTHVTAPAMIF